MDRVNVPRREERGGEKESPYIPLWIRFFLFFPPAYFVRPIMGPWT